MEIAWTASHADLLVIEESWLAASIAHVAEILGPQIAEVFGVELVPPQLPFPRIEMAQAQEIVRSTGYIPRRTDDLDPEAERRLSAFVRERFAHEFVFVTDYRSEVRRVGKRCSGRLSFRCRRFPHNKRSTYSSGLRYSLKITI